ncbi:MAG: hypothetical protein C4542_02085 [Dehalococcoidia bacterium]|nr:MAG: hypothetical protein C4542_02085 [Dehalococcoidia bacterium]
MFGALKTFLTGDSGGAVEWVVTIIAGVIIAAVAYAKLKNSPGNVGTSINDAGANAAKAVDGIRPY